MTGLVIGCYFKSAMKISAKSFVFILILAAMGCGKNEEPEKIHCGCDSDADALITNISGKIEYDTSEVPVSYRLEGYYATGLAVCNDSTFQTLLARSNIMNGDSVLFGGAAKNTCMDCEFCALISVTSITKK